MARRKNGILALLLVATFLISATHVGPKFDTRPRSHLDIFAKQYAREHSLTFINTGCGSLADAKEGVWIVNLTSNQKLTIEEARQAATDLAFQLLHMVHHDPSFANYCKVSASPHSSTEIKDEYVGFQLTFWDQDTNRPLNPYIAQIRLADGNLYYHYADQYTQALQSPIVESLASLSLPNYQNANGIRSN